MKGITSGAYVYKKILWIKNHCYISNIREKKSWFQSHLTLHKTDIQTERLLSFSEPLGEKKGEGDRRTHEEKKALLV